MKYLVYIRYAFIHFIFFPDNSNKVRAITSFS